MKKKAIKKKDKIDDSELRIEKLSSRQLDVIKNFETDTKELKDFLVDDALRNQEMGISTTYLWFYNPTNEIVAYTTVLADAIRVHGKLRDSFISQGIQYKTLPAIKIGRLCVDKNYERKGIGTFTTIFVMKLFLRIYEMIGCRFIVVDAKPDTGAIHFYKKLGFKILRERKKGTIPMYYDMIKLIEHYKKYKINLSKSKEEISQ